jgi:proteasome activator subunit 4
MADEEDDYADSVDDEYIEVDSPMEPPTDMYDDDDELQEGATLLGQSVTSPSKAAPATPSRPAKTKIKVKVHKEDRTKMMDWPESLPYECESLEEFDQRLAFIERKLIECIEAKE